MSLLVAATALALAGCSEHITYQDEGRVCLTSAASNAPEAPQEFAADQSLHVLYEMPDCLSSSCSSDMSAHCSIERDGDRLLVRSRAEFTQASGTCTADCGLLTATCSSAPLPAGAYQVVHGEDVIALTIPSSSAEAPCTTAAPF